MGALWRWRWKRWRRAECLGEKERWEMEMRSLRGERIFQWKRLDFGSWKRWKWYLLGKECDPGPND